MKYLSDYAEKAQQEVIDKAGAFFAFSNEQFKEQAQEGVNYVNLGIGLICPKATFKQLMIDIEEVTNEAMLQDIKENTPEGVMKREYFNLETQICNDGRAFELMKDYAKLDPKGFSDKKIKEVFNKCYEEAIQNNNF
jgi:hypothetical protein